MYEHRSVFDEFVPLRRIVLRYFFTLLFKFRLHIDFSLHRSDGIQKESDSDKSAEHLYRRDPLCATFAGSIIAETESGQSDDTVIDPDPEIGASAVRHTELSRRKPPVEQCEHRHKSQVESDPEYRPDIGDNMPEMLKSPGSGVYKIHKIQFS